MRKPSCQACASRACWLVIDDHELIRESQMEMLSHLGYASVAMPDVDSALA